MNRIFVEVSAKIHCSRNGGFERSQEGLVAGMIMDAYEAADQEKMKAATSKQVITFLDNQVIFCDFFTLL